MSRNYSGYDFSKENLNKLEDICKNASQVVGWYPHKYEDGNIRGPHCRWVNVLTGDKSAIDKGYIATKNSDIDFICEAMNLFPLMVKEIKRLKQIE